MFERLKEEFEITNKATEKCHTRFLFPLTLNPKFCEFILLCAAERTGAADLTGLPTENVGHDMSAPDCSNGSCACVEMKMSQNLRKNEYSG